MKLNGFTLIEVLIAVGAAAVAGTLLVTLLVQNNGLLVQQTAKINQGVSINDAVSQISELIKSGISIASSYPTSSPQYFSNSTSLVVTLAAIDASGNPIENVYDFGVLVKDAANPKILRKYIFPDPSSTRKSENKVLVTNLSSISFYYLDDSSSTVAPIASTKVNFAINLDTSLGLSGSQQSSASGQVSLRNN